MVKQAKFPNYLAYAMAVLWLWSGVQPIVFAHDVSLDLLAKVGVGEAWRLPMLVAASLLDASFAVGCVSRWRFRAGFWRLQWLTVLIYSVIIAFRLPEMWSHPFAPLLKNVPILALLWFLYQVNRE